MNEPLDCLPPNIIKAFTELYPAERVPQRLRPPKLRQAKLEGGTVSVELLDSGVVLRLSRDCPFGEISPGYLAIFVHRLAELCPDVGVAYLPGYYHPIVATLPIEAPSEDSVAGWTIAIESTIARLEEALDKQREAALVITEDSPARRTNEWPEVEVTSEQLQQIGQLAADFAQAQQSGTIHQIRDQEERLLHLLRSYDILKPDRPWVHCLHLHELRSGFWSGVWVEQFTANQLIVTLNVLYQGNLYNTTFVNAACATGLLTRITARAYELSKGSDPLAGT
jgi:hypothetical protein